MSTKLTNVMLSNLDSITITEANKLIRHLQQRIHTLTKEQREKEENLRKKKFPPQTVKAFKELWKNIGCATTPMNFSIDVSIKNRTYFLIHILTGQDKFCVEADDHDSEIKLIPKGVKLSKAELQTFQSFLEEAVHETDILYNLRPRSNDIEKEITNFLDKHQLTELDIENLLKASNINFGE